MTDTTLVMMHHKEPGPITDMTFLRFCATGIRGDDQVYRIYYTN